MPRLITSLTFFMTSLLAIAPVHADKPYQGVIAVVINKDQNINSLKLSPENLSLIFWRKQRYWPKGITIKPVNLDANHPVRLAFSQSILGSLPDKQIDYWNGQYFNGIKPPYAVQSEEAALRYVANTKGAIGYVDTCHIDDRVKPIFWIVNQNIQTTKPTNVQCQSQKNASTN